MCDSSEARTHAPSINFQSSRWCDSNTRYFPEPKSGALDQLGHISKCCALPTKLWSPLKIPNLSYIIIIIKILDYRYLLIILLFKILCQTYKNQKWLTSKISIWNCNIFKGKCCRTYNKSWRQCTWIKII